MDSTFAPFKQFSDAASAEALRDNLIAHGIEAQLFDNSPSFDVTFSGNTLQNQYQISIRHNDFERAKQLLRNEVRETVQQMDEDHYLFSFSMEELYEIIFRPDEWSEFDVQLATRILKERGESIDENRIASIQEERIQELAQPEVMPTYWVNLGYVAAIFGGIIGIAFGWYLVNAIKSLPNGDRIKAYTKDVQRHGNRIFILGIASFAVWLLIAILLNFAQS